MEFENEWINVFGLFYFVVVFDYGVGMKVGRGEGFEVFVEIVCFDDCVVEEVFGCDWEDGVIGEKCVGGDFFDFGFVVEGNFYECVGGYVVVVVDFDVDEDF